MTTEAAVVAVATAVREAVTRLPSVAWRELGARGLSFATQYIAATVIEGGDAITCASPTLPAGSPLASAEVPVVFPLEIRVSLNAQQYTAAPSGEAAARPLDFGISAGGADRGPAGRRRQGARRGVRGADAGGGVAALRSKHRRRG